VQRWTETATEFLVNVSGAVGNSAPNPALQPTVAPSARPSALTAQLPSLRCAQFGAAELDRWAAVKRMVRSHSFERSAAQLSRAKQCARAARAVHAAHQQLFKRSPNASCSEPPRPTLRSSRRSRLRRGRRPLTARIPSHACCARMFGAAELDRWAAESAVSHATVAIDL